MARLSLSSKGIDLSELEKEERPQKSEVVLQKEKSPPPGTPSSLGWRVKQNSAPYRLPLPELSQEEEEMVAELLEKVREASKAKELEGKEETREKIESFLMEKCIREKILMEKDQFRYLTEYALTTANGYSGLDALLADEELEEIAVIGLRKPVHVFHRTTGWMETNLFFESEERATAVINKMARALGRRITLHSPRLNAVLPDGSRLHASVPPVSGVEMTIRKFRSNPISIPELVSFKTFSSDALAFLWSVVQHDASLLVCGNTASGKTTTLNALFSFIPLSDRVIITEDSPEINIPHPHAVRLLANPELGIPLRELVSDCIRMRPDRVIVGEVRTGDEVQALLETLLSGQARGSYATFHADSSEEALARLIHLGASQSDLRAIDLLLVQRRLLRYSASKELVEVRRGFEVAEVVPTAKGMRVNPIFRYNPRKDLLERTRTRCFTAKRISEVVGEKESDFWKRTERRAALIESLSKNNRIRFEEAVREIQSFV